MVPLDKVFRHLNRQIEKFRTKCLDFSNVIVRALAEEEMKLRQEEMDGRARRLNQRDEPRGA